MARPSQHVASVNRCLLRIDQALVAIESELPLPEPMRHALRIHEVAAPLSDPATRNAAIRVHIRHETMPASAAGDGTPMRLERTSTVEGSYAPPRYALWCKHGGLRGDLRAGRMEVFAHDPPWLADPLMIRTMLPLALLLHLSAHGLYYAHAAVVVDPGGHGWLLLGPGGAGKSTTAYALTRAGWGFVCDDTALLTLGHGGVQALALHNELHLPSDATQWFSKLSFDAAHCAHPSKRLVDIDSLRPGQRAYRTTLHHIVELVRDNQAHNRTGGDVTGAALFARLVVENPLVAVHDPHGHIEVLTRLLAQCTRRRVRVGRGLARDPVATLLGVG